MHYDTTFPPRRLRRFMRMVDRLQREEIELAVESLIAQLDLRDGDPDLEETNIEDGFVVVPFAERGPGCAISDPGEPIGDELDASFMEWRPGAAPRPTFEKGMAIALQHEDAEDDDSDRCSAGDDHMIAGPVFAVDQWHRWGRHGTEIGDDTDAEVELGAGESFSDPRAYHRHRDRIRRTRCRKLVVGSAPYARAEYRLHGQPREIRYGMASDLIA